jgi:hypothetical protein
MSGLRGQKTGKEDNDGGLQEAGVFWIDYNVSGYRKRAGISSDKYKALSRRISCELGLSVGKT